MKNIDCVRMQRDYYRGYARANVSSEQTITDNVSQRVLPFVETD